MKFRIIHFAFFMLALFGASFGAETSTLVSVPYFNDFETTTAGWTHWHMHSPLCLESPPYSYCSDIQWQLVTNPHTIRVHDSLYHERVTLPEWAIDHRTAAFLPQAHSGTHAWWCGSISNGTFIGDEYTYPGALNDGGKSHCWMRAGLESPTFNTAGLSRIYMSFWTWWEVECIDIYKYDLMEVLISTDGGGSWIVLDTLNPPFTRLSSWQRDQSYSSGGYLEYGRWVFWSYDLTPYAGHNIKVQFRFDTKDRFYNGFRGWFIDDFYISSGPQHGELRWQLDAPERLNARDCRIQPNPFDLTLKVINIGGTDVEDVMAIVMPPSGMTLAAGNDTVRFGTMHSLDSAEYTWQIAFDDTLYGYRCINIKLTSSDSAKNILDDFENPDSGLFTPSDIGVFDYTNTSIITRAGTPPSGNGFAGIPASGGTYAEGDEWTLTSEPIPLTGFTECYISFYYWADLRNYMSAIEGIDGAIVEISINGGDWMQLDLYATGLLNPTYTGYIKSDIDNPLELKLAYCKDQPYWTYVKSGDLIGMGLVSPEDTIRIRFRFGSGDYSTAPSTSNGFYIDKFLISSSSNPVGPFMLTRCVAIPYLSRPNVEAYHDATICKDDIIPLTAVVYYGMPPYSVEWTPATGLTAPHSAFTLAMPETTSTYMVTVVDYYGCTDTDSVTIIVDTISVAISGDTVVCEGDTLMLVALVTGGIPPLNISWNKSGAPTPIGFGETLRVELHDSGWFICTVVDSNLCMAEDSVFVSMLPLPDEPILIHPAESESIDISMAYLEWFRPSHADSFIVIVNGETLATLDTTVFWLPSPYCNNAYDWQIIAINECGSTASTVGHFRIKPCGAPIVEIVEPKDSEWTSCAAKQIIIAISDSDGIDTSSIRLRVNSTIYSVDGIRLRFVNDTLTFTPPTPFSDGETVRVCLDSVADRHGNAIDLPVCFIFGVDLSPPLITGVIPYPIISRIERELSIIVVDSFSGVDTSTAEISIDYSGGHITYRHSAISVSGDTMTVDISSLRLTSGESLRVCVKVKDKALYCPPNELDSCFFVVVGHCALSAAVCGGINACPGLSINLGDAVVYSGARPPVEFRWFDADSNLISTDRNPVVVAESTTSYLFVVNDGMGCTSSVVVPINCDFRPIESVELIYPSSELTVLAGTTMLSWRVNGFPTHPVFFDIIINGDTVERNYTDTLYRFVTACEDTYRWSVVAHNLCITHIPHCSSGVVDIDTFVMYAETTIYAWGTDEPIFYTSPCSGPVARVIHPLENTWTNCTAESIVVQITGRGSIAESTIVFELNGVRYTIFSPYLSWHPPRLVFAPAVFSDGDTVRACLRSVRDVWGNPLVGDSLCWTFFADQSKPVFVNASPAAGSVLGTRKPLFHFEVIDSVSGVNWRTTSVQVGPFIFNAGDLCLRIIPGPGGLYTFEIDTFCVDFHPCDTIRVRFRTSDYSRYCGRNTLDTSWTVYIDCEPPTAIPLNPPPDVWNSCDTDSVVIVVFDTIAGIDTSSIILVVTGYDTIRWGNPNLRFTGDTLIFTPPRPFIDLGRITISFYVTDNVGNRLPMPIRWGFEMDRIPPIVLDFAPACGESIPFISPELSIFARDDGCGVQIESTKVTLNDTIEISYAGGGIHYAGGRLIADCSASGIRFRNGDSVRVCWHLVDCADVCEPNVTDTCCTIFIIGSGPEAHVRHPSNVWVSCPAESIAFVVIDDDGVIADSIRFVVCVNNCTVCDTFSLASPAVHSIFIDHDSVSWWFIPPSYFNDGDTICAYVISAADSITNPLERTDTAIFWMDLTPPVILWLNPEPYDTIEGPSPTLCIGIYDFLSGIQPESFLVTIDTVEFRPGDPGFYWSAGTLCINTEEAGKYWLGGDSIRVCIRALDSPDICPPNVMRYCYRLYLAPSPPVAIPIRPDTFVISACPAESIVFKIYDPQGEGIEESTIVVTIESNLRSRQTLRYGIDSELIWNSVESTLVVHPAPPLADGETTTVCVVEVTDTLGNALEDTSCIRFLIDLTPPTIWGFSPTNNETIRTSSPTITFSVFDSISGVNDSLVEIVINGVSYNTSSPGFRIIDTVVTFATESVGLRFTGGECVQALIRAGDSPTPGYCEPNIASDTLTFCIAVGGPTGLMVKPSPDAIISCDSETIGIVINDIDGVMWDSVAITVNDSLLSVAGGNLIVRGDTVLTLPLTINAETVVVCLTKAIDSLGNNIDTTQCWQFFIDHSPPSFAMLTPENGTIVGSRTERIVVHIGDNMAGIDTTSIELRVNGELQEFAIEIEDSLNLTITFDPQALGMEYAPGETVFVNVSSCDNPDVCAANCGDTTFWFWVVPIYGCSALPNPFTPNADGKNDIIYFTYPNMFAEPVENFELVIFDIHGIPVYTLSDDNSGRLSCITLNRLCWDGKDTYGNPLPQGIYLYVITKGGEVVCKGSIVLAR